MQQSQSSVDFTSVKGLLIDLAGVLYVGGEAVPGALEAMQRLRASGLPLCFITNTSRTPRDRIVQQLQRMGFEIHADEILTAASAARKLVLQRGLRPHYLVHPDMAEEMGESAADPDAVVLGDAGEHFTYDNLNAAFRLLMKEPSVPLMAMAKNRYFKEAEGLSLDMGGFVSALEFAAGVTAEVVGKPAPAFFNAALNSVGLTADEVLMIGDDLHDDIGGAQACGIAGVLVRTGKYRPEDEETTDGTTRPSLIADDFSAVVQMLLKC